MDTNKSKPKFNKPIVGVFLNKVAVKKLIKKQTPIDYVRYEKANKKVNLTLYYFSIDNINIKQKVINGTYYNKQNGTWEKKAFPFPNIIYKRYKPSPTQKPFMDTFEEQLRRIGTKPLNYPLGFNKWDVYRNLSQYPDLKVHLPFTILYKSSENLEQMLANFNKVYLKACRGGRGKQVLCITKLDKGGYSVSYFVNKLYRFKFRDFSGLHAKILAFYKKIPFIIQEAIDLITVKNCLVDMRPEVQRDGNGEIFLAGLPVRIGNCAAPITTHATSYTFEYFFQNYMNYSKEEIILLKERILVFLKKFYQGIEAAYGQVGEIGIDIGLDKNDRLWFIECNSRSRKVSFLNAYDDQIIDQSYINLLEYAKYIYKE